MDGLGQDVPATMKKPILHSKLTHARRPRAARAPPARSALRATSLAARVPVQNGYMPSPFFKIQNLTFHLSPPRPLATLAALR